MQPMEQRWERIHPFLSLTPAALEQRLRPVVPGARVLAAAPLAGGLRNSNYRVRLADSAAPGEPREVVVRFYTVDPAACRRELALAARLAGTVPVPAVLHADPDADQPLDVVAWVEGTRLDDVLRTADPAAAEGGARAAGTTLAAVHAVAFPGGGFLGPDLTVQEPLDLIDGWAGHLEHFLFRGPAAAILGEDLTRRLWRLAVAEAPRLAPLRETCALVHADYKHWNLLVRPVGPPEGWRVAAVLDWEFAFAGPPLLDVAIFLRHRAALPPEYTGGFVTGYVAAGGRLPGDWLAQAQLLDLLNLCMMLGQPGGGPARSADLRALIRATVDGWPPT